MTSDVYMDWGLGHDAFSSEVWFIPQSNLPFLVQESEPDLCKCLQRPAFNSSKQLSQYHIITVKALYQL